MKNSLLIIISFLCLAGLNAQTQNNPSSPKSESLNVSKDLNQKEHVCTATCKKDAHVYAHGEKGHKCGAACMRNMSKTRAAKPHVCNAECTESKHNFIHGEQGHICGTSCRPSKKPSSVNPEKKSQ